MECPDNLELLSVRHYAGRVKKKIRPLANGQAIINEL
jgi:hypothetical protein